MGEQLDEAGVDQDAGADGVEDAVHDERRGASGLEALADAETRRDGDGRRYRVHDGEQVGHVPLGAGPGGGGEPGAQTETLEGLVEDQHDVEDAELVARDGQREADEDRVEDDTELEDEDRHHLRREGRVRVVLGVLAVVAQVVLASRRVADVGREPGDLPGLLEFVAFGVLALVVG